MQDGQIFGSDMASGTVLQKHISSIETSFYYGTNNLVNMISTKNGPAIPIDHNTHKKVTCFGCFFSQRTFVDILNPKYAIKVKMSLVAGDEFVQSRNSMIQLVNSLSYPWLAEVVESIRFCKQ